MQLTVGRWSVDQLSVSDLSKLKRAEALKKARRAIRLRLAAALEHTFLELLWLADLACVTLNGCNLFIDNISDVDFKVDIAFTHHVKLADLMGHVALIHQIGKEHHVVCGGEDCV